jgi:hypothetical protein
MHSITINVSDRHARKAYDYLLALVDDDKNPPCNLTICAPIRWGAR